MVTLLWRVYVVPPKFITADEAKLMILDHIENYETKVGAARHRENTNNFTELYKALNQLKGAVYTVGVVVTAITIVFKIIEAVKH